MKNIGTGSSLLIVWAGGPPISWRVVPHPDQPHRDKSSRFGRGWAQTVHPNSARPRHSGVPPLSMRHPLLFARACDSLHMLSITGRRARLAPRGPPARMISWIGASQQAPRTNSLWPAPAIYFAWYNFCRVHQSLRVTPAMEAGIADRVWTVESLFST